jgi:hypothetical protein
MANEQLQKIATLARSFSPGAPVSTRDLFAGRLDQLNRAVQGMAGRGQHVVIYGERGVGKTSIVQILGDVARAEGILALKKNTVNCDSDDTFTTIMRKIFRELQVMQQVEPVGFQSEGKSQAVNVGNLFSGLLSQDEVSPEDVRHILQFLPPSLLIIDELDTISELAATAKLAHLVKTLSDHSVPATLVMVGVADSVHELISEHTSIERSLTQIKMPRMSSQELHEILEKALAPAAMTISDGAKHRVAGLSRGLPHYTHLLGLKAAVRAVMAGSDSVDVLHVDAAIPDAVADVQESIRNMYTEATDSPRKGTLFRHVLLACALAETDEEGFFRAKDVRAPLRQITGKQLDIPTFAQHLNDFSSDVRGPVLQKVGAPRRWRFRFINPLLEPYVVIKALDEGLITKAVLRATAFSGFEVAETS